METVLHDDIGATPFGGAADGANEGVAGAQSSYAMMPCTVVSNSLRRRIIAQRLSEITQEVPHLSVEVEVDMEPLAVACEHLNLSRARVGGGELSIDSCIAAAVCQVLIQYPEFNATYTHEARYLWGQVNLAIAVNTADGPMAPVIVAADALDVYELGEAIESLTTGALRGELAPEQSACGTFTLWNAGALGPVVRAGALVNLPQVAVLTLPAIRRKPVVVVGEGGDWCLKVGSVLNLVLTFDHRALDANDAMGFLTSLTERLKNPVWLTGS